MDNNVKILKISKDKSDRILNHLKEKDRKMGKNPSLKEWFELQNKIKAVKRSTGGKHDSDAN